MPITPDKLQAPSQEAASQEEESGIHERPTVKEPETFKLAPEQYEAYQKSVEQGVGRYVGDTEDFFRQAALLKKLEETQSPMDAELRREASEKLTSSFDATKFVEAYGQDADVTIEALAKNLELPKDIELKLKNKVAYAMSHKAEAVRTIKEAPPVNLVETVRRQPSPEDLMRSTEVLEAGVGGWERKVEQEQTKDVLSEAKDTLVALDEFKKNMETGLSQAKDEREAQAFRNILANAERESINLRQLIQAHAQAFEAKRNPQPSRPTIGEQPKDESPELQAIQQRLGVIEGFMNINESLVSRAQEKQEEKAKQEKAQVSDAEDFGDLI